MSKPATTHTTLIGMCFTCNTEAIWAGYWGASETARMKRQRKVWEDTHYGQTGHHRFYEKMATSDVVSVATVSGNQLKLTDDPDHSVIQLGGPHAE